MNFITTLLTQIDNEINHYTFDVYHQIVSHLSITLTTLFIIYIAGFGWMVIRGLVPLSPLSVAWHLFKVGFVFAFALHWDYFAYFIASFFLHGPDKLLADLLNGIGYNSTPETITQAIAHAWQTGSNVFTNVWRDSGPNFLLGNLLGLIGYSVITGITAIILFYLIMSKIALSLLLVLAPIMLPMLLWNVSLGLFNGWLRLLIKWSLMPTFIYTFSALYITLLQTQIDAMTNASNGPNTADIAAFVLLGCIIIASIKTAANIVHDLTKSINISSDGLNAWLESSGSTLKNFREKVRI